MGREVFNEVVREQDEGEKSASRGSTVVVPTYKALARLAAGRMTRYLAGR